MPRNPSHFGSKIRGSPRGPVSGTSSTAFASIGSMGRSTGSGMGSSCPLRHDGGMAVPLRDRVLAPETAPLPDGGLLWRGATPADVDAVLALYRAADPVDHPHYRSTREEIEHELT